MSWNSVTDPSNSWSDVSGPPHLHTYGAQYGKTTRVVYGDNVRYGGLGFESVSDPSDSWSDIFDPWTLRYEANVLPEDAIPVWSESYSTSVPEISPAGYLHLVSNTDSPGWYKENINLSNVTGFTFETRLKVISGEEDDYPAYSNGAPYLSFRLDVGGNVKWPDLLIYSNAIRGGESGTQYLMDTTNGYHVYRITIKDGVFRVYVDKVLRIDDTDLGSTYSGSPKIDFLGDVNGVADIETSWDYVYYYVNGAFAP